jgi:hypothetical protein
MAAETGISPRRRWMLFARPKHCKGWERSSRTTGSSRNQRWVQAPSWRALPIYHATLLGPLSNPVCHGSNAFCQLPIISTATSPTLPMTSNSPATVTFPYFFLSSAPHLIRMSGLSPAHPRAKSLPVHNPPHATPFRLLLLLLLLLLMMMMMMMMLLL